MRVEGEEAENKVKKAVCTTETALEETDSRDSAQLYFSVSGKCRIRDPGDKP